MSLGKVEEDGEVMSEGPILTSLVKSANNLNTSRIESKENDAPNIENLTRNSFISTNQSSVRSSKSNNVIRDGVECFAIDDQAIEYTFFKLLGIDAGEQLRKMTMGTTMFSPGHFSTLSLEDIPPPLPPSPGDILIALPPPVKPKGGEKASRTLSKVVELSVFDVLNIFHRWWFLSRTALLAHVISAQKVEDGDISWVEFNPPFHSHLVKCAVVLVPRLGCPVPMVKRVMFVFILELLNREGHLAFFDLQKGGRKANNAQKEKRRLARKQSRAAKQEREREAGKMAHLPTRERSCLGCGRMLRSVGRSVQHGRWGGLP
jgi:hypothetical protein